MDTPPPFPPHVSPAALAHTFALLAEHEGATKTSVGEHPVFGIGVANLTNIMAGRRPSGAEVIGKLAGALGCDPLAITCWCDRPGKRCRSAGGAA